MADALVNALIAAAHSAVEVGTGPRERDLTVRLASATDLPAVATALAGGQAMALATVVATDERVFAQGA